MWTGFGRRGPPVSCWLGARRFGVGALGREGLGDQGVCVPVGLLVKLGACWVFGCSLRAYLWPL